MLKLPHNKDSRTSEIKLGFYDYKWKPKKLRDQSKGVYLDQELQRPQIPQLDLKPQLYIKERTHWVEHDTGCP